MRPESKNERLFTAERAGCSVARRALVAAAACVLIAAGLGSGCVRQEEVFTQGRIQTTCGSTIPICDSRAACVLDDGNYVEASFPGGLKSVVRTETADNRLVVRFLLRKMVSPGTEILVRAHEPGCGDFEQSHPRDVDLFERAGDDRILQFELPLRGEGDHLLEIFSDMGADYTMTTTVEDAN